MKRFAIIPAGGSGKRLGTEIPKQFMKIDGKETILYTLRPFIECEMIDKIVVAVSESYLDYSRKLFAKFGTAKPIEVVIGGKERQDSVFAALSFIDEAEAEDFIVVHDAARALLPRFVLENALKFAESKGNAVAAIKARDTLAVSDKGKVTEYIDRSKIFYIQTPQIFKFKILKNAMQKAKEEGFLGTDESTLVRRFGEDVFLVEGSPLNFKITTKEDFMLAEAVLKGKIF